jgi:hypothetical protein
LSEEEIALTLSTSSWESNHPSGMTYFDSYKGLFENGKVKFLPDTSEFKFKNSSSDFKKSLLIYIQFLIETGYSRELIPVFKFEQMEGHVELLRSQFSNAIHICITRTRDEMKLSWLEQLALGNHGFFSNARRYILEDPIFFASGKNQSNFSPDLTFEIYYDAIERMKSDFDLCLDLSKPNLLDEIKRIESTNSFSVTSKEILIKGLVGIKELVKPSTLFKFQRLLDKNIKLQSELTQLHAELNNLKFQLNIIRESKSYRYTGIFRRIMRIFYDN